MDSSELILTGPVDVPTLLDQQLNVKVSMADDEQKKQFAKDFESVFLDRLFSEMKKTIVDWSGEKNDTDKQVEGIFWSYLARGVAGEGGLGLSKDIYNFLTRDENTDMTTETLDKSI